MLVKMSEFGRNDAVVVDIFEISRTVSDRNAFHVKQVVLRSTYSHPIQRANTIIAQRS